MVIWMGLAMMVPTRLWIAGLVSKTRDSNFTDKLLQQVRNCCVALSAILICMDGLKSYPKSIIKAFREKVKDKPGPGAPRKEVWPDVHIGVVVKRMEKRHVKEVIHRIAHGTEEMVNALLTSSKGGKIINAANTPRLNGTFRDRLVSLTRKYRYAASKVETLHAGMYLIGSVYNFCSPVRPVLPKQVLLGDGRSRQTPGERKRRCEAQFLTFERKCPPVATGPCGSFT